jgi:hypothetical protein
MPKQKQGRSFHFQLGRVLEAEGKLKDAEAEFREAAILDPDNKDAQDALKRIAQKK